jgi:hypothetical protein
MRGRDPREPAGEDASGPWEKRDGSRECRGLIGYLTVMRPWSIGARSYVATGKLRQLIWRVREVM